MAFSKVIERFDEAVGDVEAGSMVHIGGFSGSAEIPSYLIAALARRGVGELTIVTNLSGVGPEQMQQQRSRMASLVRYPDDYFTSGLLITRGQVKKGIMAFPVVQSGMELPMETELKAGRIDLELTSQGTLAERIRAARAGIGGFYTPVGVGTHIAADKEVREFGGVPHVLETPLKADFAFIRANRADRWGNLVYGGSTRTFNATMAGAARVTIAEVNELVELGDLDPDHIVTPAPLVQRVVPRPATPMRDWQQPC
jgi:3-oxoadipate CoA-transferase, alpha subunit